MAVTKVVQYSTIVTGKRRDTKKVNLKKSVISDSGAYSGKTCKVKIKHDLEFLLSTNINMEWEKVYAILFLQHPAVETTFTEGDISGNLTVSASVNHSDAGPLTYQWYVNTVDSNEGGMAIVGATQPTFTIPASLLAGNYFYYCVVTLP